MDSFEILSRFELLASSLNKLPIQAKDHKFKADLNSKSNMLNKLQSMCDEFIKLSKDSYDHLDEDEREALTNLARDTSIVISKADKGNAVVIQDKLEYIDKVKGILNDKTKFKKLDFNPTTRRERALRRLTNTIENPKDSGCQVDSCAGIRPTGSRPGVLYGLPKVHKTGNPVRPIISAVNTYNYR